MFESSIEIGLAIVLSLIAVVGWSANIVGLPGNWLIVLTAVLCWWLRPEAAPTHIGLPVWLSILAAAVLGEILEFIAGALGASRMGGSRRGALLAIVGSIGGAVVGLFVGTAIPIPIVGNLIASLLMGAAGAFAGAIAGERWAGRDWEASLQIGSAAFWGRLLGTVGKAVCGTVACGIFLAALWL